MSILHSRVHRRHQDRMKPRERCYYNCMCPLREARQREQAHTATCTTTINNCLLYTLVDELNCCCTMLLSILSRTAAAGRLPLCCIPLLYIQLVRGGKTRELLGRSRCTVRVTCMMLLVHTAVLWCLFFYGLPAAVSPAAVCMMHTHIHAGQSSVMHEKWEL